MRKERESENDKEKQGFRGVSRAIDGFKRKRFQRSDKNRETIQKGAKNVAKNNDSTAKRVQNAESGDKQCTCNGGG